jgi:dynein heavy chain
LAASAETELAKALPSLQAAQHAVEALDKKDIAEIKAFTNPPKDVAIVMGAVMTFLRKPTDWPSVKKELTDSTFVNKIMDYEKDNISPNTLKAIEKYTKEENFRPDYVSKKSVAAGQLCAWVCAIEDYAKCLKIVNPKREAMAKAQAIVAKLEENMQQLLAEFERVQKRLGELNAIADIKNKEVEQLRADLMNLQSKIDRGDKLVSGLADEKVRWENSLVDLD